MYTDPVNGYVGVPYGYFDGYDYCYKYELFRLTAEGFVRAGHIESHETEDAFEFGRARLAGGMLYIFSEGRNLFDGFGRRHAFGSKLGRPYRVQLLRTHNLVSFYL